MKCFKCSGRHHVAVCTFQNRDSGNPLQPQKDHTGYEKTYRYIVLRSWNQFLLSLFLFLVKQAQY